MAGEGGGLERMPCEKRKEGASKVTSEARSRLSFVQGCALRRRAERDGNVQTRTQLSGRSLFGEKR